MTKIAFTDLKDGDIIRVTEAAHMARKNGFSGAMAPVPERVRVVRVKWIADVPSQPGRRQAWCTVLVTHEGEDLRDMAAGAPTWSFFHPNPDSLPALTIERAE